jgi:CheY-like chemotaxis protein
MQNIMATHEKYQEFAEYSSNLKLRKNEKNILIVDDSESITRVLSAMLHDEGNVYTAINGMDALSKFPTKHFDVIISDIEMPFMNGIDFYKNVTILHPYYKEHFLFFSGTRKSEHLEYVSLNNLRLFRKPDDILILLSTVKMMLASATLENAINKKH